MDQHATRQILAEILLNVGGNRKTLLIRLPTDDQSGFHMTLNNLISCAEAADAYKPQCLERFSAQLGYRSPQP